jgi:xanthine dehydrogenase accessory factor
VATVLVRHGSTPSTPGQKLLVLATGDAFGTVGGGAVEREVLAEMAQMLSSFGGVAAGPLPPASVRTYKLGSELGMCCGGRVDILIEPLAARVPVLIVGAGHVGRALAPLLAGLGFAVTLSDARDDLAPLAHADVTYVQSAHDELLDIAAETPVLVMTHDHQLDQAVIEWALRRGARFVGGVGSRAKAVRTRERLTFRGLASEDSARVRMPLGVDIGARTPGEIAVAIAAELIAWRAASSSLAVPTSGVGAKAGIEG